MAAGRWVAVLMLAGCTPADTCFSVEPKLLDFGEVAHGTIASSELTLRSTADQIVVVGEVPAPFRVAASRFRVPADDEQSLAVSFTPRDARASEAELAFSREDGTCRQTVTLHGRGAGTFSVVPNTLDFGFVRAGTTKSLPLTLVNSTSSEVRVIGLAVSFPNEPFRLPPLPIVVPPHQQSVIDIVAAPMMPILTRTRLTLTTRESTRELNLEVSAEAPVVRLERTSLEVPVAPLGLTISRHLRLRNLAGGNPGEHQLRVSGDATFLEGAGQFEITSWVVQPSTEAPLDVHFTGTALGPVRAFLRLTTNDPVTPSLALSFTTTVANLEPCRLIAPQVVTLTPQGDGGSSGELVFGARDGGCVVDDLHTVPSVGEFPAGYTWSPNDEQFRVEDGAALRITVTGPTPGRTGVLGNFQYHLLQPGERPRTIGLSTAP